MKTSLVLSGGGAKGSIQFGILKYLTENGLTFDDVYGTSVGALNATGLAFGDINKLEKIWNSLKSKKDIFKFNWHSLLFLSKGLYNGKPLKKLIENYIQGSPKLDSYACKVSLVTGEIKYSHCKDLDYIDSVVASASVPGITEPIGINGWVDGGIREQTPLKQAILNGADKIIVVLCNPLQKNPDKANIGNWLKNAIRTTDILSHEIMLNDIDNCLWYNNHLLDGKKYIEIEVYAPESTPLNTSDFTQDKIQLGISHGYECAKKGPVIKG